VTGVLRITIAKSNETATIKLEGKLLGPWLPDIREALSRARALAQPPRSTVRLDLAQVMFVDVPGEQMLQALLREGVEIADCSSFVAELLQMGKR
jgi:hypothetical protein